MNDPNDLHKPMPPPPPLIPTTYAAPPAPTQCCGAGDTSDVDAPTIKLCTENGGSTELNHSPAGVKKPKPFLNMNNDWNCNNSPNFNRKFATKSLPTTPSASLLQQQQQHPAVVDNNVTKTKAAATIISENGASSMEPCLSSAQTTQQPSQDVGCSTNGEMEMVNDSGGGDNNSGGGATATATTGVAKMAEFDDPHKQLLLWQDMPQHLQFNPYVLTGYRPLQTFKGCMCSLFYMHNETINILTHGIPIVYILATVPGMMPWETEFRFLSWCHLLGSVAPWCGSFVYHLFMNLERGEHIYYKLLQLDMFGIWISQSIGALPMITATVFCWRLKWVVIIAYSLLCVWGLYKAMTAASPWERRLCFLMPFCMRVILTIFRILRLGGGEPSSLTHVFLQDGISIFGGAIGAMHIPEKWFPGAVDYYLNSHNIMHILVVLAVYSMHQATVHDIEWMTKVDCSSYNATEIQSHQHVEL